MEDIVIDTSVLVKILIYKDEELFRKINKFRVFVPVNVVEETCFKVIISLVGEKINSEKFYEIKNAWENGTCVEDVKERLEVLKDMLSNWTVLPITEEIIFESFCIQLDYNLLPNDALIAATCKYYGINKIATFDEDFERIEFLEVVKI